MKKRGVYAINRNGGVHKYESRVDDIDLYVDAIGGFNKNLFWLQHQQQAGCLPLDL